MCVFTSPRYGILLAGIIMLFVFGSQLATLLNQPDDIWWTPAQMMQSYDQGSDRIEIYIDGEHLQGIIESGQLVLVSSEGEKVITNEDVRVRYNNYDRVRADRIEMTVIESGMVGGGIVLVIFGLMALFGKRGIGESGAACDLKE